MKNIIVQFILRSDWSELFQCLVILLDKKNGISNQVQFTQEPDDIRFIWMMILRKIDEADNSDDEYQ